MIRTWENKLLWVQLYSTICPWLPQNNLGGGLKPPHGILCQFRIYEQLWALVRGCLKSSQPCSKQTLDITRQSLHIVCVLQPVPAYQYQEIVCTCQDSFQHGYDRSYPYFLPKHLRPRLVQQCSHFQHIFQVNTFIVINP